MGAYNYGFRPLDFICEPDVIRAAASQTITQGDFIIDNGSGRGAIALANSPALLGVAAATVVTTAADEATDIPFYPAKLGAQFVGYCENTPTETMRGMFTDIIGATGAMMIDDNASTTDVLQFIRAYEEEAAMGARSPAIVAVHLSQYQDTVVA